VNWKTNGGTATAGSDYTVANGTLAFPPGAGSQTFTVRVFQDGVTPEAKETIKLLLSGATSGITLTPNTSKIAIRAN
jgi:hypothetical protein